jgi:hypothetical protein
MIEEVERCRPMGAMLVVAMIGPPDRDRGLRRRVARRSKRFIGQQTRATTITSDAEALAYGAYDLKIPQIKKLATTRHPDLDLRR